MHQEQPQSAVAFPVELREQELSEQRVCRPRGTRRQQHGTGDGNQAGEASGSRGHR